MTSALSIELTYPILGPRQKAKLASMNGMLDDEVVTMTL